MKRTLVAGLMAAALLAAPMGLSFTTGGPGLSLVPAVPTAYAARVKATSTGDSQQDDYCGQVADLINEASDEAERQHGLGNIDEEFAWVAVASQIMAEARRNGCEFVAARAGVDLGGILGEDLPTLEETPGGQGPGSPPSGDNRPPLGPGVAIADAGNAPSSTITETQTATGGVSRPADQRLPGVPKPGVIEIAPADLQVGAVEVKARDGGRCVIRGDRNVVSATIKNAGGQGTGQFAVEVKVGNERRGNRTVSDLGPTAETTLHFPDVVLDQGERNLQVVVDPDNMVKEGDETNNTRTVAVDCTRR